MRSNDDILNEWAERAAPESEIIRDGIIDQDAWNDAQRKVLFLLKEGYTPSEKDGVKKLSNKGWDLRVDLRNAYKEKEFYGSTLREAAYWAHGILNAQNSSFPQLSKVQNAEAIRSFNATAVLNVKKTPGDTTSNWHELKGAVEEYQDLLKEQIASINPDIIVCGNTWRLIEEIYADTQVRYDQVFEVVDGFCLIDYWHPASRASRAMKYYALEGLLRGAKEI